MSPKPKQTKQKASAQEKQTRQGAQPDQNRGKYPVWDFSRRDSTHERWGWERISADRFLDEIWPALESNKTMTWQQIESASGGKSAGNGSNSHFVNVSSLCRKAQKRLKSLGIEQDVLFSLRFGGTKRLYGYREANVFFIIWLDEHHEIYPSGKR